MTGGTIAILGLIGDNFSAGMTGGMAFVYDADGKFAEHVNPDTVVWQRIATAHWDKALRDMVEEHALETGSAFATELLTHWERERAKFWQVVPKEMAHRLPHPLRED